MCNPRVVYIIFCVYTTEDAHIKILNINMINVIHKIKYLIIRRYSSLFHIL